MRGTIKHKKFGRVCMCDCHKDGSGVMHVVGCCRLTYRKYINEDGTLDEDRLLALYQKYGIPLWTWWDHLKDWFSGTWIARRWQKWIWWRRLKHFKLPMIKKTYPVLKAEDIVSVQPMTALVPDGTFKYVHKGQTEEKDPNG